MRDASLHTLIEKRNYTQILTSAENEVRGMFKKYYDPRYVYHNLKHTENVVAAAREIANHFQLDEYEFFIVIASAWFHDVGYLTRPEKHEVESAEVATSFLKQNGIPKADLEIVKSCILSTRLPQSPKILLEEIVCDADLYHLGTDRFFKNNSLMHQEVKSLKKNGLTEEQWMEDTVKLLKEHEYHTDYCRLLLNDTKEKNLNTILKSDSAEEFINHNPSGVQNEEKKKKKKPKKGIETMFRIAANSNQRLSKLADYKARNMITVNSIILSAVLSLLLKQLDVYTYPTIPTYLLLLVYVLTLVFSILATRPTLAGAKVDEKKSETDKKNRSSLLW